MKMIHLEKVSINYYSEYWLLYFVLLSLERKQKKAEGDETIDARSETNEIEEKQLECTGTLTNLAFETLNISDKTKNAIKDMGFVKMTEIQAKSLPDLLKLKNLVGIAKTGSGKTLAFLIHAIEFVFNLKYRQYQGTGVIILSPTRELAMQTYGVLNELMKYHNHSYALIIGGANKKKEAERLFHGNIICKSNYEIISCIINSRGKYSCRHSWSPFGPHEKHKTVQI